MSTHAKKVLLRKTSVLISDTSADLLKAHSKITWKVQNGNPVVENQLLGTLEYEDPLRTFDIIAPIRGLFFSQKHSVEKDDSEEKTSIELDDEDVIGHVEECLHPIKQNNMCLMCLHRDDTSVSYSTATIDTSPKKHVDVMFANGQTLQIDESEAKELDLNTINRQLKSKKLSLILDLDHTLLHATSSPEAEGMTGIHSFFLGTSKTKLFVKLRPKLEMFLSEMSKIYDLNIYTHGTRLYAEEIVKIIDPNNCFFGNRIVSRCDTEFSHKSLHILFPSCDDSMVLILDDRVDVWKKNASNVILIEPYHFFTGMTDVNNASGDVSSKKKSISEIECDDHLSRASRLLTDIHSNFYENDPENLMTNSASEQLEGKGRDVKIILGQLQKSVFKNCFLVFSGLIPSTCKNPRSHPLWRMAESFGASVSFTLDNFPITHLVINPERLGTDKHRQVQTMKNVKVVNVKWVTESVSKWQRQAETNFLLTEDSNSSQEQYNSTLEHPKKMKSLNESLAAGDDCSRPVSNLNESTNSDASPPPPPPPPPATETARNLKRKVHFSADTKQEDANKVMHSMTKKIKRSNKLKHSASSSGVNIEKKPVGLVASGGSFDFLQKIANRKPSRAVINKKKANLPVIVPQKQAPTPALEEFNEDDIFKQFEEAEEKEEMLQKSSQKVDSLDELRSSHRNDQKIESKRIEKMKKEAEVEESDSDSGTDNDLIDELEDELFN